MSYDNTCYEQTMKQEISYTTGIDFLWKIKVWVTWLAHVEIGKT
jgi:hypothetical protein